MTSAPEPSLFSNAETLREVLIVMEMRSAAEWDHVEEPSVSQDQLQPLLLKREYYT